MKITYDHNYGADADGNRGISVVDDVELDDDDFEEVKEAISEKLFDEEYSDEMNITLDVDGAEFDFDVYISDYLTKEEYWELLSKL